METPREAQTPTRSTLASIGNVTELQLQIDRLEHQLEAMERLQYLQESVILDQDSDSTPKSRQLLSGWRQKTCELLFQREWAADEFKKEKLMLLNENDQLKTQNQKLEEKLRLSESLVQALQTRERNQSMRQRQLESKSRALDNKEKKVMEEKSQIRHLWQAALKAKNEQV